MLPAGQNVDILSPTVYTSCCTGPCPRQWPIWLRTAARHQSGLNSPARKFARRWPEQVRTGYPTYCQTAFFMGGQSCDKGRPRGSFMGGITRMPAATPRIGCAIDLATEIVTAYTFSLIRTHGRCTSWALSSPTVSIAAIWDMSQYVPSQHRNS